MTGRKSRRPFWRRLFASIIDHTIVFEFIDIAISSFALFNVEQRARLPDLTDGFVQFDPTFLGWVVTAGIYFGYFAANEIIWNRTIGKRIAGVKVVSTSGARVTSMQIVLRNVFRIVDMIPVPVPLGIWLIAVPSKRMRIGDIVGRTTVEMS